MVAPALSSEAYVRSTTMPAGPWSRQPRGKRIAGLIFAGLGVYLTWLFGFGIAFWMFLVGLFATESSANAGWYFAIGGMAILGTLGLTALAGYLVSSWRWAQAVLGIAALLYLPAVITTPSSLIGVIVLLFVLSLPLCGGVALGRRHTR